MLLSTTLLNQSLKNMKQYKKENFSDYNNHSDKHISGSRVASLSFMMIISIIFFIFEFLLLFYCIVIALKCTEPGPERIVHIVLVIMFTLPYALISVFFSKCAKKTLIEPISNF